MLHYAAYEPNNPALLSARLAYRLCRMPEHTRVKTTRVPMDTSSASRSILNSIASVPAVQAVTIVAFTGVPAREVSILIFRDSIPWLNADGATNKVPADFQIGGSDS